MKYLKRFWPLYLITALIFVGISVYGNDAVTTMAEAMPVEREVVFIIDPGHGGEDGGAVSCTGVLESNINLEISLRLNDLLHLLGFETVMTRTEDVSIYTSGSTLGAKKASDLRERVKIVNGTEKGILLSIHQNFFSQAQYSGAQMFYNHNDGAQDMAKALQSAFKQTLNPGSNRQSKKVSGIYLQEHIDRPGILIECGFLSNAAEEAKLRSAGYQKNICCVIAATVTQMVSNT